MNKNEFKYYIKPNYCLNPENHAYKLIQKEKIIIDSKYIEVIEAGENNFCTAWIELQEGFAYGTKGIPKNYKMARYYTDKMIYACLNDTNYSKNIYLLFESYRASGYLEIDNGNIDGGKTELIKAIQTMVNHVAPDNWDYSLLNTIKNITR